MMFIGVLVGWCWMERITIIYPLLWLLIVVWLFMTKIHKSHAIYLFYVPFSFIMWSNKKAIRSDVHTSSVTHAIDQSHKSLNVPILYPTMHHFVTEMCTCVHISITKWCIVEYWSGALKDLWAGSVSNGKLYWTLVNAFPRNGWYFSGFTVGC